MGSYRRYWLCAGVGWVLLVVYLSLANVYLPQSPVSWSDKLNHFVAYGFLMTWLGQLARRPRSRVGLALGLIALGALMEILQGLLPYRWFDVADALANCGGVVVACLLLYLGADKFLGWLEYRLDNTFN